MYRVRVYNTERISARHEEYFREIYDAEEYAITHTRNTKNRAYIDEVFISHINGKEYKLQSSFAAIYRAGQIIGLM